MKEAILSKIPLLLLVLFSISGCSTSYSNTGQAMAPPAYLSRYLVPNQLPAPQSVKSIQLHRERSDDSPPVIRLGTSEKLILSFDELSELGGQFRVTFTHYDANWNESNIPVSWYMTGFNEMTVGGGIKNRLSQPGYYHYQAKFPNDQIQFKASGNYMLHVADFSSGIPLFSLPFFVTENKGELTSWVETKYNAGPRGEAADRPFSTFIIPDFIEYPQFDLSFYFAQNRFWGDTRRSESYDFSEQNRTRFHLSSEKAFPANFDFIGLDISRFTMNGNKVIDWQPGSTPPRLVLREDVLNFTSNPIPSWGSTFGNPADGVDARYANVEFRFLDSGQFTENEGVYLIGDFNQWLLSENNRLSYDKDSGYWTTTSLIKQGTYTYKYAVKSGEDEIDDIRLSDSITRQSQEYISLVYFRDPEYRFQRLLQVQLFRTEAN